MEYPTKPKVKFLDHLVLTVADFDKTIEFYRLLGLEAETFPVADGSVRTALKFGRQKINLHAASTPYKPHARRPAAGSADFCLLSDQPLDVWLDHLGSSGVPIESGPVDRTGAAGPIKSIYLRDPDGNLIEISNQL